MKEVLCVGAVLLVLVWRQHSAQKEIDRQITLLTREVVAVGRELEGLEVKECAEVGPQVVQAVHAESENVDFYREVIHFPETENDLGKELQLEGKHEAAILGPSGGVTATTLVKQWTISQKIFVQDPSPSDEFTGLSTSERWSKVLIHDTGLAPPKAPKLDLLWVNLYTSKDESSSYPEMMELIRYWAPKLRIGSILAVADVNTKQADPALSGLVVAQVEREYGLYKATAIASGGHTTWLWRVHREL